MSKQHSAGSGQVNEFVGFCGASGDLIAPNMPVFDEMMKTMDKHGRVKCYSCGRIIKPRKPLRSTWGCAAMMLPRHKAQTNKLIDESDR